MTENIQDQYDTCLLNLLPVLDALRFTSDVRSILQRNRVVNNFCHYWDYKMTFIGRFWEMTSYRISILRLWHELLIDLLLAIFSTKLSGHRGIFVFRDRNWWNFWGLITVMTWLLVGLGSWKIKRNLRFFSWIRTPSSDFK